MGSLVQCGNLIPVRLTLAYRAAEKAYFPADHHFFSTNGGREEEGGNEQNNSKRTQHECALLAGRLLWIRDGDPIASCSGIYV